MRPTWYESTMSSTAEAAAAMSSRKRQRQREEATAPAAAAAPSAVAMLKPPSSLPLSAATSASCSIGDDYGATALPPIRAVPQPTYTPAFDIVHHEHQQHQQQQRQYQQQQQQYAYPPPPHRSPMAYNNVAPHKPLLRHAPSYPQQHQQQVFRPPMLPTLSQVLERSATTTTSRNHNGHYAAPTYSTTTMRPLMPSAVTTTPPPLPRAPDVIAATATAAAAVPQLEQPPVDDHDPEDTEDKTPWPTASEYYELLTDPTRSAHIPVYDLGVDPRGVPLQPECIYNEPRSCMYFLRCGRLLGRGSFGFPRKKKTAPGGGKAAAKAPAPAQTQTHVATSPSATGTSKEFEWRKMSFVTGLPKKHPLVRYITATCYSKSHRRAAEKKKVLRMHAVMLASDDGQGERGDFVLVHIRAGGSKRVGVRTASAPAMTTPTPTPAPTAPSSSASSSSPVTRSPSTAIGSIQSLLSASSAVHDDDYARPAKRPCVAAFHAPPPPPQQQRYHHHHHHPSVPFWLSPPQ